MKSILIILFLALITLMSQAQTITGTVTGVERGKVNLFVYQDYVTYTEVLAESVPIQEDGTFALKSTFKSMKVARVKIGKHAAYIHLEPGASYEVAIEVNTAKDGDAFMEMDLYMPMKFKRDDSGLNSEILKFSKEYDDFLADNIADFVKKRAQHKVDSFKTHVQHKYDLSTDYFHDYVKYAMALMDLNSNKSRKKIFLEYLKDAEVQEENDAYMAFVAEFYHQFFATIPLSEVNRLEPAIKENMSWTKVWDVVKLAPYSDNEKLLELVTIMALNDNFHKKDFTKKGVRMVLNDYMLKGGSFGDLARRIVVHNHGVDKGSYAPDFELTDQHGNPLKLSDYQGKYVYVEFWATWCKPCVKEMAVVASLKKTYGRYIEFVSVSIDRNEKKMLRFLKKNPDYKWHFAWWGNQKELKENYNVKTLPLYYLIDPYGRIVESPSPRPTRIKDRFEAIKQKGRPRKKPLKGWR